METMETVSKICIFAATNQVEGFKQELALHPEAASFLDPKFGATPLHLAANRGAVDIVQLLLNSGNVDTEIRDRSGVTALYAAVGGGHLKIVEMLIAAKARVHVVDIDGLTPLHEAANSGHAPLVQLLLKRGAKAQHAAHSSGATALHMAAAGKRTVDWYQVLGVSRDATQRDISVAYRKLALKFHPDKQGSAPHMHVHKDSTTQSPEEMFKRIAAANELLSDPEKRSEYDNAYPNVIEALLKAGAQKQAKSNNNETPAMLAIRCRNFHIAVLLSDDVDAKYRAGRTALHHALTFFDAATVKSIISRRADVTVSDDDGATALHVACGSSNVEAVKFIIEAVATRANMGAIDALQQAEKSKKLPLIADEMSSALPEGESYTETECTGDSAMVQQQSDRVSTCEELEACSDETLAVRRLLAAQDKRGQTALVLAVLGGDVNVTKVLMAAKADPYIMDESGANAMHWAKDMAYTDVEDVLKGNFTDKSKSNK